MNRLASGIGISLCAMLLSFVTASSLFGEELTRDQTDRMGTPASGPSKIVGYLDAFCVKCHDTDRWNPDRPRRGDDGWILNDEINTWKMHDVHHQAYSILHNNLSQQMAQRMKKPGADAIPAHQDRRCLACHSSARIQDVAVEGDLVTLDTQESAIFNNGISCEACHGPMGKRPDGSPGWGTVHYPTPDRDDPLWWRSLSPQEKFEQFGYWDVHSSRTQTRICLSCHLGNVEQGKIITHEMYAAGHPPLPSFELSQFIRQMPGHWRRLDEKEPKLRDQYYKVRAKHDKTEQPSDDSSLAVTKASLISALVVLEESMQLTADLIDQSAETAQWPELANYACFNCHHELQQTGWRKTRKLRLATIPGRPALQEWPFALQRSLSTAFADKPALSLSEEINAVKTALNAAPYGKQAQLKQAALVLANAAREQSNLLQQETIDRDAAQAWLNSLALSGTADVVDYDSARQLVWAYERTQNESLSENRVPEWRQPLAERLKQGWNPEIPPLKDLDQNLVLWLRSARSEGKTRPAPIGGKNEESAGEDDLFSREQFAVDMHEVLGKIAKYNPAVVQKEFGKLTKKSRGDNGADGDK